MLVNTRKLGLCEPSAAPFLEPAVADAEDDAPAVPLADEMLEVTGYTDPRGLTSNRSDVA